jgi:nitroreductase
MLRAIKKKLVKIRRTLLDVTLPQFCYKSGILSSLYYTFFNSSFKRENKAVLAGKVKHIKEAEEIKSNYFLLVRNTHRIEKGLLMRPRREVFAIDFIGETLDSYIGVVNKVSKENNPQIKWFTDVLSEYFKACKPHPVIDVQRERFLKIRPDGAASVSDCSGSVSIPYYRNISSFANISFEEFYKLNKQRRSVRWFLDKPLDRALIDKAILAAIQAPSACNRQPFEYHIIDNKDLLQKAVELPMGTKGYAHSIQALIIAVGNLDAYFDERDRHLIYIDASLANMTLMLALETLGLASCPINWPDIESRERKMDKFLKLKPYQRPIMCMGIGYPDPEGMVAYSEKRQLDQIRKYS